MVQDINVVVLGGCGFLGQHVIAELLSEKERVNKDTEGGGGEKKPLILIKDIKVLDVKSFTKDCLTGQREGAKIVNYQVCDVCNVDDLTKALKGASAVINCAASAPDFRKDDLGYEENMEKVNVEGTRNIVRVCQKLGIRALVHTSSVSVKMGGKRLIEHTESLSPEVSEDELVLGDYDRGKLKAEKIALDANGLQTDDGAGILRTLVLRPPLLYGEGDTHFVPVIYDLAKASGNKLPSIGHPAAFTQAAYAGNIAAAHVRAMEHLLTDEGRSNLQSCGGLPVYVTDDSPPNYLADLASTFLSHANFEPSNRDSYWCTSLHLLWADLTSSIKSKIGLGTDGKGEYLPSWPLHKYSGTIAVVSRMRAELCLGYSPVYSWEDAVKRSNLYYSRQLS